MCESATGGTTRLCAVFLRRTHQTFFADPEVTVLLSVFVTGRYVPLDAMRDKTGVSGFFSVLKCSLVEIGKGRDNTHFDASSGY